MLDLLIFALRYKNKINFLIISSFYGFFTDIISVEFRLFLPEEWIIS